MSNASMKLVHGKVYIPCGQAYSFYIHTFLYTKHYTKHTLRFYFKKSFYAFGRKYMTRDKLRVFSIF
jgi:hypothetical protein